MFRKGKAAYLHRLTARMQHFRSIEVGEKLSGSSPPSVFIGHWNYPKVYAGPMLAAQHGDTSLLDTPELWLSKFASEIVNFRLCLVRGKAVVGVKEIGSRLVGKLQEIALAKKSAEAEAEFKKKPQGVTFSDEHQPFGPSAYLKKFDVENARWNPQLEKFHYDTDLRAADAVITLYKKGLLFSQMQKAFSVGAFGLGKNRKLVPTRWSITAVDDILGKYFLKEIRGYPLLENYQVYEFKSLSNYFAVLLMPTVWQYENFEAFIRVLGNEVMLFSDWEPYTGRKAYSEQGGCYYSARLAIAEHLFRLKRQAGAIVFREAYPGYIPLGVWNVRENVRAALQQRPKEFPSLKESLSYIRTKLYLPLERFKAESRLLRTASRQTRLSNFSLS